MGSVIGKEAMMDQREEMSESPVVAPTSEAPPAVRSPVWVMPLLLALTVLVGIGIGIVVSGGASAGQGGHLIKVSTSEVVPTGPVATAMALSEAFAQVARMVEPAVVHIETETGRSDRRDVFDFFGPPPHGRRRGTGSGVIVDPSGYILTNHHVIEGASTIRVKLRDGRTFTPDVVGTDPETDLAVIKISAGDSLPAAKLGDSDRLKVGDWVLAIGSPFGLEQTVTAGIISAKDRVTEGPFSQFQRFLQTDAAINPGNSGGPLINLLGEVVGINTQIPTNTGTFNGVGFALPSTLAVEIYNHLVTTGRVTRGYLGVWLKPVTPPVARLNGLREPRGALVQNVIGDDSPAGQAGLRTGDIIIAFEGHPIEDSRDLTRRVASTEAGRTVQLTYIRDGRQHVTSVRLGTRPSLAQRAEPGAAPTPGPNEGEREPDQRNKTKPAFGARLDAVTPQVARSLNLPEPKGALVSEVDEGSMAEELGLMPGDVILRLNRREISGPDDVKRLFESLRSGDDVVIVIARPSRSRGPSRDILSGTVP
jgi:serine protease Do